MAFTVASDRILLPAKRRRLFALLSLLSLFFFLFFFFSLLSLPLRSIYFTEQPALFSLTGLPGEAQRAKSGGAMRDRTADLLRARQALSQLSYSPGTEIRQRNTRKGTKSLRFQSCPIRFPFSSELINRSSNRGEHFTETVTDSL